MRIPGPAADRALDAPAAHAQRRPRRCDPARRGHHLAGVALAIALAVGGAAKGQYEPVNPWDEAVRQLERATRYDRDGTHHPMLTALRQLKDPALKPLFQSLVQSSHWSMQVSGVFGLAELDPKGVIDPFLLAQVESVADRSTAIIAAVQLGMVDRDQAVAMLAWENLTPRDRAVLYAELAHRGDSTPLDAATRERSQRELRDLLADESPEVVGLAAFVLASQQPEPDQGGLDRLATLLGRLTPRERSAALASLSAAAATFGLKGAVSFIDGSLKDAGLLPEARSACIGALLALSPDVGYTAWSNAVGATSSYSLRVRLALVLLASDMALPPGAATPLRNAIAADAATAPDDPLLGHIADAIDGIANGDVSASFPQLVRTKHGPSMLAVLTAAKRLDTAAQRATYLAFVALLDPEPRGSLTTSIVDLCLEAASRLAALDVAAIVGRYDAAPAADAVLRDLLLLALAAADTPEAAAAAYERRAGATKRTASLILVTHARFAPTLPQADIDELGRIAAGGSPLEGAMQAQAAWLFARHLGRTDQAIVAILAKEPPPRERPTVTNESPKRDGAEGEARP